MLVLASASPRRRELLAQAGYSFEVHPAHIPEDPLEGEDPFNYVTRLAREKAEAVFRELTSTERLRENAALDGRIASGGAGRRYHGHARQYDSGQAGRCRRRSADVAAALRPHASRDYRRGAVTAEGAEVAAEATAVRFLELSDEEIAAYVATGEPMDKAGAYAIQGRAARWIPRIEGCYFNVVGLPLALVSTLLASVE